MVEVVVLYEVEHFAVAAVSVQIEVFLSENLVGVAEVEEVEAVEKN